MNSSSPSARLRPFRPQPFGRYTLLSHLATGGMGEIYLARLEGVQGFEKLCVIKKILPQLAEDKEFVDRFVGEARTLVKLSHGSIAQVLDMGLHEGDAYMALEYVDGKDLRKVAGRVRDRQMPLPLTFVLFVMGRVLDALAYAHRKRDDEEKEINLVHRDISPQNILISYEGEVKVIDFGLAKSRLSAAKTNPSIILGKFLYMSPEQAKHHPVDRRSDLYAVGLCLYELISGKNPFDSVHSGELMSAVANPRIPPLNEVEPFTPPPVAHLVMKALAVDPAQRFQTAEEFRGRLMGCLMEIDRNAGPETVSRFMRDVFSAEYQGERKLLAQLKDVPRGGEPIARVGTDLDTDPGARFPPPALPPRTVKLDGPAQPLSFQPTPRSRQGTSVHEEETRPGVAVSDSTRPAVSFEALDAAARARVRPSLPTSSPSTETVTMELRVDDVERAVLPVASAAPVPLYASAPTVEIPIPFVPAAAIPPGVAQPSSSASRTQEPPRPGTPPAPPVSSPAARPVEPPRASVPPASHGSAPTLKSMEMPRAAPPPMQGGSPATRPPESSRTGGVPPPPTTTVVTEPRGLELPRGHAQAPGSGSAAESAPASGSSAGLHPPPPPVVTLSEPMLAVRDVEPRGGPAPASETAQPHGAHAESPVGPRESHRASAARSAQAEPGGGASRHAEPLVPLFAEDMIPAKEVSRRGLDDTHPSYQMASGAPPEDTQPRVVLDDAAFREHAEPEERIIVSGVLEEAATPARAKGPARRPRSSAGMPSVARGAPASARSAPRPVEPEPSRPPVAEEEEADVDVDLIIRDPRDETRKTPLPTRPGENSRRIHREEPRRAAAPAPARKRSWAWLVVSVLLLVVAGAAVVVAFPQLEHLLPLGQGSQAARPPPAVPIRPAPVPSGPPGTALDPSAPGGARPAAPRGAPPGAVAGSAEPTPGAAPVEEPVPAGATAAKASPVAEAPPPTEPSPPGSAEVPDVSDDIFVPLPAQPGRKPAPARVVKKVARSKEAIELQRDWSATRGVYETLTREQSCDSPKIGITCRKFLDVKSEMDSLGDGYKKELHTKVKKVRKELEKHLGSGP